MNFTKADLLIIIQGLDVYNLECTRKCAGITDPSTNDNKNDDKKVLSLEEFVIIHNLIGEVRKKAIEQYQNAEWCYSKRKEGIKWIKESRRRMILQE